MFTDVLQMLAAAIGLPFVLMRMAACVYRNTPGNITKDSQLHSRFRFGEML
jgi:hypothetical protein